MSSGSAGSMPNISQEAVAFSKALRFCASFTDARWALPWTGPARCGPDDDRCLATPVEFVEHACPLADKCIISAIEADLAVLAPSSASQQEKLEALKYLGYWVGDVHQPLHVSFEDDRGGNEVGISGGLCSWDLHAVWNSCIIEEGLPGDPGSIARDLLDKITDQDRAAWRASRPIDWANESFAISVSPEVGYCVRTEPGCWYDAQNQRLDHGEPERTVLVDRPYVEVHAATVLERLVRAGVRLGGLLNGALGR